jgi:hypothetical protein
MDDNKKYDDHAMMSAGTVVAGGIAAALFAAFVALMAWVGSSPKGRKILLGIALIFPCAIAFVLLQVQFQDGRTLCDQSLYREYEVQAGKMVQAHPRDINYRIKIEHLTPPEPHEQLVRFIWLNGTQHLRETAYRCKVNYLGQGILNPINQ